MSSRYDYFNAPFSNFEITTQLGTPPAAPSSAALVTGFLPTNGIDQTPAIVAQPLTASNTGIIITMTITDGDNSITYAKAWITGKDRHGRSISDTITATPSAGSATYYSSKAFYSDVAVTTHVDGAAAGDLLAMGWSGYDAGGEGGFGLPWDLGDADDIDVLGSKNIDNVADAGTLDVVNQVWHPATIPNSSRRYRLSGRSSA